ncbi:MAG: hypothetical protein P4L22_01255 [Candidatus Babeliales bacterium]|nr:hypothetical protein [Candidatus Babeliales bacterium]
MQEYDPDKNEAEKPEHTPNFEISASNKEKYADIFQKLREDDLKTTSKENLTKLILKQRLLINIQSREIEKQKRIIEYQNSSEYIVQKYKNLFPKPPQKISQPKITKKLPKKRVSKRK